MVSGRAFQTHSDQVEVNFHIVGEITEIELIASGRSIRELKRLRKVYGRGRWRKLKGNAPIRFSDGTIHQGTPLV